MLSSTNVYFSGSGLFNELQPIQIKNFSLAVSGRVQVVSAVFPTSCNGAGRQPLQLSTGEM
jgi:hypothetical protein